MKRSIALGVLLCASLCLSTRADAECTADQKAKATALYDKGNVHYNLGRYKEAIDLFTQAYETCDSATLLFNIGQAYRNDGNCSKAIFFYKRYLALKPDAKNRSEVEKFIAQLQPGCVEQAEEPKPEPPKVEEPKPDTKVAEVTETPEDDTEIEDDGETEVETTAPHVISLRAAGGGSYLSAGDNKEFLFALSAGVAYPLQAGEIGIEPGALVTYTPVPWERMGSSGTIGLTGLLANAGLTYPLGSGFGLRGDVGLGVLIMSGLGKMNNPFLEDGDVASGALSRFHLRLAAGVEYAVAPTFILHAQPVVSYSPAGADLQSDINSITRFEILIGAGYRL